MKARSFLKSLAVILAIVMLVGVLPMNVLAASLDYTPSTTDDYYKLITKDDYDLAPGIVESEIVLNNIDGTHRQVAHVVEVDLNNPYTKVVPSSKGMVPTLGNYGTQIMSEQAAFAEANGYGNVVAAMNIALSWYDASYYVEHPELVGEPLGYLILDGEVYMNSKGQSSGAQTCVVINFDEKDGEARPTDMPKLEVRSTSDAITGWEEQVIPANFGFLVKDGVNLHSENHTTDSAPRSFMGIKEDGTFVMVMNDGRQSPYSTGFNYYEMAEFMISLGCVAAVNGDGGGSSQFLSQRPGEELELHCSPSDGTERPTTHGILVISTAPATGEFVRATISTEYDYYTPGSTVEFNAVGSDLVGTLAEIPESAQWRIKEEGMGTIENGIFVSNGNTGTVTVEMVYNDEVVGSASINIVIPDTIEFAQSVITVPNGKSTEFVINAVYDSVHTVTTKASDFDFQLSDDAIGTISDMTFTATSDSNITGGSVTVTFVHDTTKTSTAEFRFGKASEIIWDFENGTDDWDITIWKTSDKLPYGYLAKASVYGVNAANGKVRNGEGAMAMVADFAYGNSTSWNSFYVNYYGEDIKIENAQSIGCWVYIPDEIPYIEFSLRFYPNGSTSPKNALVAYSDPSEPLQPGWQYVSFDISSYQYIEFKSGYQFIQIYYAGIQGVGALQPYPELNSKVTYYIDDVTIDYSTAVEDREAPVFGNISYTSDTADSFVELSGQTTTDNVLSFEASVSDFVKDNATGVDPTTAKVYIDGVAVDATYANGRINSESVELADGIHKIVFEIADRQGNVGTVSGKIDVQAASDIPTINVIPHDATLDRILLGSLYYVDIEATDIETVDKVVVTLDLNNHSTWELDHMTVANGFAATYEIDPTDPMDNIATITITRVGDSDLTGTATLASLPIRTWEWKAEESPAQGGEYDLLPEQRWAEKFSFRTIVRVDNIQGNLTCVDDAEVSFAADMIQVDTELFANSATALPVEEVFEGKDCWHTHTVTELDDEAPTCTEKGYTDRTFCEVCNSVVDWGTDVPATGHTHKVVDGKYICSCGDEPALSGLNNIDGKNYYFVEGKLASGWFLIGEDWYLFDENTFAGLEGENVTDDGVKFDFEGGKVTKGAWTRNSVGYRYWYGPGYYNDTSANITSSRPFEIDGNTYLFNRYGYMQTGIVYFYTGKMEGNTRDLLYYDCGDDGVAVLFTGIHEDRFYINGVLQEAYKLVEFEGNFYFIDSANKLLKDTTVYLNETFVDGFLYANGTPFAAGYYSFDSDGKMLFKDGPVGDYFYEDGVLQTAYKLVEYDGAFYFIDAGNKLLKNARVYLSEKFVTGFAYADGTALKEGYYEFDSDGKMVIKNGPIGDYFYKNGVLQTSYKLVEYDGEFYFVDAGNKLLKNTRVYLSEKFVTGFTYADGSALEAKYYEFDSDGKMVIKNGPIGDYLYKNGVLQTSYKLVEYDGAIYFIDAGNKLLKNTRVYLNENLVSGFTYANGTPFAAGYYDFDADGKMLVKDGPVGDYFYVNGVLQTAYKLVEYNGDYYFIDSGNKLIKNARVYLNSGFVSSIAYAEGVFFEAGYYTFDASGKMVLN